MKYFNYISHFTLDYYVDLIFLLWLIMASFLFSCENEKMQRTANKDGIVMRMYSSGLLISLILMVISSSNEAVSSDYKIDYVYDEQGRLVHVNYYFGPEGSEGGDIYGIGYEMDVVGNRKSVATEHMEIPVQPEACRLRFYRTPGEVVAGDEVRMFIEKVGDCPAGRITGNHVVDEGAAYSIGSTFTMEAHENLKVLILRTIDSPTQNYPATYSILFWNYKFDGGGPNLGGLAQIRFYASAP